jgi:hypothetical protein
MGNFSYDYNKIIKASSNDALNAFEYVFLIGSAHRQTIKVQRLPLNDAKCQCAVVLSDMMYNASSGVYGGVIRILNDGETFIARTGMTGDNYFVSDGQGNLVPLGTISGQTGKYYRLNQLIDSMNGVVGKYIQVANGLGQYQ